MKNNIGLVSERKIFTDEEEIFMTKSNNVKIIFSVPID